MNVNDVTTQYLANGRAYMSDVNLMTLIIGDEEKARNILQDNNFKELGKMSISDLKRYGLTEKRAVMLSAVLEIGRRRESQNYKDRPVITRSRDAYESIAAKLHDLDHEQFWLLCLNKANRVLKKIQMSIGGTDATIVDMRLVFKRAISEGATAIICAHNHPSGKLLPSQADLDLTKKIKDAGEIVGIRLLDHVIVADGGYYSFADEGLM